VRASQENARVMAAFAKLAAIAEERRRPWWRLKG
jgi:hypothetical protein